MQTLVQAKGKGRAIVIPFAWLNFVCSSASDVENGFYLVMSIVKYYGIL